MDICWNRTLKRVQFLCVQVTIVGTLGYLTFVWFCPEIIESNTSVAELQKKEPQEHPIHSEATLSGKFGRYETFNVFKDRR